MPSPSTKLLVYSAQCSTDHSLFFRSGLSWLLYPPASISPAFSLCQVHFHQKGLSDQEFISYIHISLTELGKCVTEFEKFPTKKKKKKITSSQNQNVDCSASKCCYKANNYTQNVYFFFNFIYFYICVLLQGYISWQTSTCVTVQVSTAFSWLYNQTKLLNLITSSENTILED